MRVTLRSGHAVCKTALWVVQLHLPSLQNLLQHGCLEGQAWTEVEEANS